MKTEQTIQRDLFSQSTGESLAIAGMTVAKENADRVVNGWSRDCWLLFLQWLSRQKRNEPFMIETFRKYLKDYDLLEEPPSNRAFGFISKRAVKQGWIQFAGMGKVSNKKAHACFVGTWIKI